MKSFKVLNFNRYCPICMAIDFHRLSHHFHLQLVLDNSLPFCNSSDWKVVSTTWNLFYVLLRIRSVVNKVVKDHQVDQGIMMMTECKKIRLISRPHCGKLDVKVIA
jgi:hypothetical protein